MGALKKFISNKTTITFLGIILGIAVLVGGYTYRIEQSVSKLRVPIAKRTIKPTEQITADDIEYVRVNNTFIGKSGIMTENNINSLVNHYVNVGTSVPKGGVFYKSQIVEKKELPNSIFDSIPDGYTIYQLKVDVKSTYANSIFPGDIISLWMRTTVDGKLVYGEFISNIEVLAVRDSAGLNVFDVTTGRTPAWLLFAVPTEMYRNLKIAEYLGGVEIVPVPTNNYYVDPSEIGATEYSNQQLVDIIESKSIKIGVV